MYLRIAAFKNKKDDPLACMTEGEGQEIAAALAALTASCLEMWIKDIPDDKKEELYAVIPGAALLFCSDLNDAALVGVDNRRILQLVIPFETG